MEQSLVKLFKLANKLNEKQDKIFAQIEYTANDNKKLEITIRSKKDFSYIEKCEIQLSHIALINLDNLVKLFEDYVGGAFCE